MQRRVKEPISQPVQMMNLMIIAIRSGHLVTLIFCCRSTDEDFDLFVNQKSQQEGYLRFHQDIEDFVGSVVRDQSGDIIHNGAVAPGLDVEAELSVPYEDEAVADVVVRDGEQLAVEVHAEPIDDVVSVDLPQ